jgi:hypothetical protein
VAFQLVDESSLSAIVRNVAALVSYPTPSDPAGSQDPSIQQMVQAVNLAGVDMLSLHDWQELTKRHTISVSASTPGESERGFDLPEDFYEFTDQTQWNSTMQWPAVGPISPQMWQQLLIRQTLPTLSFYWQVRGNQIYILSPPTAAQTLSFFYQSVAWVRDQDVTTTYKNRATKNGDVILLDSHLMTLLARAKWLEMKGLDSSAAMRDFTVNLENRKGNEKGSPVLTAAREFRFPFITPFGNTPDTGFGS